jgi:hypothetical protein
MKPLFSICTKFTVLLAVTATFALPALSLRAEDAKEPLKLKLPMPTLKGTPEDLPSGPGIEQPLTKPPADFIVPKGVVNVAAGKPVTSSVKPFTGELAQVTDGDKEAFDDQAVETKKGTQWVQIDLGGSAAIAAIAIWHDHRYVQLFRDVIVQVSDDPEFKTGVTTLYNNDTDNSSGLGIGTDKEYFEGRYGRVVDGKNTKGRYVRSYTKGSNQSAINTIQEIEVYAPPVK